MNWISNYVRPKINAIFSKKDTPEHLWKKCSECGMMLFHREIKDSLYVCNGCGHHMQISIAQELIGLPKFRKYGGYTAYTEGWGLYSEFIPKEMGFYSDPISDFGRLAMELWRSCRLVVDTGIHTKKWTREKSIRYYLDNTPNDELDCIKMVERHIVYPSQATAYKIGMNKIIELRNKARARLGDNFDIRYFHETILSKGAVPLNILEQFINEMIEEQNSLKTD